MWNSYHAKQGLNHSPGSWEVSHIRFVLLKCILAEISWDIYALGKSFHLQMTELRAREAKGHCSRIVGSSGSSYLGLIPEPNHHLIHYTVSM